MDTTEFEFDFTADALPFLDEWVVDGEVEFPFSACLEMVFAALRDNAPTVEGLALKEIYFHQPIVRGKGRLIHLQIAPRDQRFQIVSRDLDRPAEHGRRHLSGRFEIEIGARDAPMPMTPFSEDARQRSLTKEATYQRLEALGLACGPSFRVVNRLWLLSGGARARVEIADRLKTDLASYLIHPVLLGSALQVVSIATVELDAETRYRLDLTRPAYLGKVTIFRSGCETVWVEARTSRLATDREARIHFDITLWDANGRPLAELEDLCLMAYRSATAVEAPKRVTEAEVIRVIDEVVLLDGLSGDTNLFTAGATSLDLIRLINALQIRFGRRVDLETIMEEPTVKGIVAWFANESQRAEIEPIGPMPPGAGIELKRRYPLTPSQQQLWFLEQRENTNQSYNEQVVFRLTGPLLESALEGVFNDLIERHESLRTVFEKSNGEPCQVVQPFSPRPLPVLTLDSLAPSEREAEARALAIRECRKPFDLSTGPLFRYGLIRLDQEDHLLVVSAHHIITDDWSLGRVIMPELSQCYRARALGLSAELTPLRFQYRQYALYTKSEAYAITADNALDWWKKQLQGVPHLIEMSSEQKRPPVQSHKGSNLCFSLPGDLVRALRAVAQRQGTTVHAVLLAAFSPVVSRLTQLKDFCIGIPTSDRSHQAWESLVGCFVDLVPCRVNLEGNPTFSQAVTRIHRALMSAVAHRQVPFSRISAALGVRYSPAYSPLAQLCFIYRQHSLAAFTLEGITVAPFSVNLGVSKFDLSLQLSERVDVIDGVFEYNTDILRPQTVERIADRFLRALAVFSTSPDTPLEQLCLLSDGEKRLVLNTWNRDQTRALAELPIQRLFERQVDQTPRALALTFLDDTLCYLELDGMANRVARFLQSSGIEPGDLVAIDMASPMDRISAMLSILKAGAGYVPLDRKNPVDRLAHIVSDARVKLVLSDELSANAPIVSGARVVLFEEVLKGIDRFSDQRLSAEVDSGAPAYVVYTSGSTGTPKGVLMHHKPLTNLIQWQNRNSRMGIGSRTLQLSSFGFDVWFQEIASTLSSGGHLVLLPEEHRRDPFQLLSDLNRHAIERVFLPFVALRQLAKAAEQVGVVPTRLKEVITAGEALQIDQTISRFFSAIDDCVLYNQYGPSETHVVTQHRLRGKPDAWPALPPIGRPIDNVEIYILNERMVPVGIGEIGELYLGGACVSRGYLNRPQETAARFVAVAIDHRDVGLFYRSGDQARYRDDGEIAFVGRSDDQVKIRGYRIEPGEIEATLHSLEDVKQAAVVVREYANGDRRICAYISPADGRAASELALRQALSSRLPDYMIPTSITMVDRLPLTASGKVDRRALRDREPRTLQARQSLVLPRSPLETQLVEAWRETLKSEHVSIGDDFFKLGGNSLLLMELMTAVKERSGYLLSIAELLRYPTIEGLAAYLQAGSAVKASDLGSASIQPRDGPLIELKPGDGTLGALVLVHAISGCVYNYLPLVEQLNTRAPIYGIQNHAVDHEAEHEASMEKMAESYIDAICARGIDTPIALVGHSMGGAIAYEMACQLVERERPPGVLALLDTTSVEQMPASLSDSDRLALILGEKLGIPQEHFRRLEISRQLDHAARVLFDLATFPRAAALRECGALLATARANEAAFRRYRPRPYSGDLIYIKAREAFKGSVQDREETWLKLAKGKSLLIRVAGNHFTMLSAPCVRELAAALEKQLAVDSSSADERPIAPNQDSSLA
ncbi:MAG: amino acid adenylation domain-containing protein [Deltaproteobacteria bacterium]|nr:amino acid adenylation domain-containing protein [Deltaproteobacteria bacterium]